MIGKWLGGVFGLFWGASMGFGFLGMLLGIWLGHHFDLSLRETLSRRVFSGFHDQQKHSATKEIFFLTTFEVMGHLAKADGHVSKDEIAVAERAMHQLNFDTAMRKRAIASFNRGKSTVFQLEMALGQLKASVWGNPILLQIFVDFQLKMAMADGVIGPRKKHILEIIGAYFNLSGYEHFSEFHQRSQHTQSRSDIGIAEAYKVLGVEAHATPAEIKKAYRRKMREHHPDRLIAKGLPEEMIKLATEKTKAIQRAYETIKKQRRL